MKRTSTILRWRTASVASCLLVAAACTDTPTTMGPSPAALAATRSIEEGNERGDSMFVSNAVRYADAGQHPTSARAGSAIAAALALLSADGTASVEVAAGEWDGWTRGRKMRDDPDGDATLSKVQLKAFASDGSVRFTRNFNGLESPTASLPANGLLRGDRAQIQANIKGADPSRTGVVTLSTPVRLRPDLAVTALQRPPRAALNTAVPINAVVRELNGELGAWADCVLYVDGIESDRAYGIWIDAGGTVTCTFSHQFRRLADTQLEVRVERVAPGDFDNSNNSASGVMPVIRVPSAFSFYASFEDRFFSSSNEWEWSSSDKAGRQGNENTSTDANSGRTQQSVMYAAIPREVTFPLSEVFARQSTRDEVAHSMLFRQLRADWTSNDGVMRSSCVSRGYDQPSTGRGWLYICSQRYIASDTGSGFTTVQYDRYAGDVTYASRGYSHYWNRDLGIDDVYSWNYGGRDLVGRFVSYGLEYGFFLRLIDGANVYTTNPLIGLLPFNSSFQSPRTCWSWEDDFGSSRSCSTMSTEEHGVRGWVSGDVTP